ncbi:DUF1232 domain-containing protein [Jeotgalibacillus sp. R-1-5s-1]|uniref:DUF1232 domain-containing protein n=1 Tax=Jeotgalibacillus sp. R-1-5s-1 TaxID=2555897 RepID=UPI00106A0347|nr:DUF1232 domain-containing protein [Jeotgalibacillus sp. R-1-5s-1]TFE03331.1 DUF1232 domain-containing protein [Jeotgalibacillus sp. R-1-5s-1]
MPKFLSRVRFLFTLKKSFPFLKDYFTSRHVHPMKKIIPAGLAVAYLLLPIDLLPDYLGIIGLTDDLAIVTFLLQLTVKMAPEELAVRHRLLK